MSKKDREELDVYVIPPNFIESGKLFGGMFKDAIKNQNPFALASIFFFMLMMIFIPCNNQIGQTNDNLCPFILLVLIWLICKREKGPKLFKRQNK